MRNLPMFLCFLLLISGSAFSQTEKGYKMIGGSGYVHLSDDFYMQLTPSFGRFLFNNFAAGLEADFSHNEYWPTTFAMGPFLRYYIGSGANRILFSGSFAYGTYDDKENYYRFLSRNSTSVRVGAGYTRFLSQQVGLEAILNYQNLNVPGMYFNDRLFASLGIQVYLPPRKRT